MHVLCKSKRVHIKLLLMRLSFSQTERNYSPTDRELLAMRWGIKAFRDFLFGVKFVVYSDHRPLIYLKNLSKVNARLARTLSELEEYEFEIRYRPGPQNEAADALSRIVEAVESTDLIDGNYLPKGLKIVEKIDGGGNSLFEALLVILDRANKFTGKFEGINNCQDLRTLLINHLLTNTSKFNFKAGQIKTKEIRSMLIDDVMPCMEVLMAASDLFNVTIHVHHGMKYPLVYKSSKLVPEAIVIHLQCKSGIHFNPVAARSNADTFVSDKLVQFVDLSTSDSSEVDSFTDDLQVMVQGYNDKCICKHKETENFCTFSSSIEGYNFCSLIDTGAEVSLISEELWVKIKSENRELILKDEGGNLVGVGNQKVNVLGVVELNLKMLDVSFDKAVPFAVIQTDLMLHCCILRANFIVKNDMIIDFDQQLLYYQNSQGEELFYPIDSKKGGNIAYFFGSIVTNSKIDSSAEVIPEVKYVLNNDVKDIQNNDFAVRSLIDLIERNVEPKYWKNHSLDQYKRYCKDILLRMASF